jgi:hypothetical protein
LSLALQEKHRVNVFKNRMLRRIFGPKEHEITVCPLKWRSTSTYNLFNGKTFHLYSRVVRGTNTL